MRHVPKAITARTGQNIVAQSILGPCERLSNVRGIVVVGEFSSGGTFSSLDSALRFSIFQCGEMVPFINGHNGMDSMKNRVNGHNHVFAIN